MGYRLYIGCMKPYKGARTNERVRAVSSDMKWKVCCIQMDVISGRPELNRQEVKFQIEQAMRTDPALNIMVLPEMWNTGYAWDCIRETADKDGQDTLKLLRHLAETHQVHIVGGSVAVLRSNGGVQNVCYVINKHGELVHQYIKVHLFQLMGEHLYMKAGEAIGCFELDGVRCGVVICYDLRFPEWIRAYALAGVELLFVPAQWPKLRQLHWRTLLLARAIENQMVVVACNRCGDSTDVDGCVTSFGGGSIVLDAWGEALAEIGDERSMLIGEVDVSHVASVRTRIPIYKDRRAALYENMNEQLAMHKGAGWFKAPMRGEEQ